MTMFTTTTTKSVTILTVGLLSANLYGCSEKDANTCIAQGKAFGDKKPEDDCCSGAADTTNKKLCGCIAAGAALPKHAKDGKDCCAPAAASADKKTCCIPKGGEADKRDQCCSGILGADGKCAEKAMGHCETGDPDNSKWHAVGHLSMTCVGVLQSPNWHGGVKTLVNDQGVRYPDACCQSWGTVQSCLIGMKDWEGTLLGKDCSTSNVVTAISDDKNWMTTDSKDRHCWDIPQVRSVWASVSLEVLATWTSSDGTKFKDACKGSYDLISRCHKAGLTDQHACSENNIQKALAGDNL